MASSPCCLTAGGRAELSPPGTMEQLAADGAGAAGEAGRLPYRYVIVTQRGFVGAVVAAGLSASGGHGNGSGRWHQRAPFLASRASRASPLGLVEVVGVGWPGPSGRCCER